MAGEGWPTLDGRKVVAGWKVVRGKRPTSFLFFTALISILVFGIVGPPFASRYPIASQR